MQGPHEGTPVSSGDAFQHIQLSALHVNLEQVHTMQALRSLAVRRIAVNPVPVPGGEVQLGISYSTKSMCC